MRNSLLYLQELVLMSLFHVSHCIEDNRRSVCDVSWYCQIVIQQCVSWINSRGQCRMEKDWYSFEVNATGLDNLSLWDCTQFRLHNTKSVQNSVWWGFPRWHDSCLPSSSEAPSRTLQTHRALPLWNTNGHALRLPSGISGLFETDQSYLRREAWPNHGLYPLMCQLDSLLMEVCWGFSTPLSDGDKLSGASKIFMC